MESSLHDAVEAFYHPAMIVRTPHRIGPVMQIEHAARRFFQCRRIRGAVMVTETSPTLQQQIKACERAAEICDNECVGFPGGLWAAAATLRKIESGEYRLVRMLTDLVDDTSEPLL